MNEKQAIKNFDKMTEQEKLRVCQELNSFVTFNSISKGYVIHAFKWLYGVAVKEVKGDK